MAYFLNLFSPETYEVFTGFGRNISGFRVTQKTVAEKVHIGDKFVCYMTKLSRWVGILEVLSEAYIDNSPLYYAQDDPFVLRFKVRTLAWLEKEHAIPIREDIIWNKLSFTKGADKNSAQWTGRLRSSLGQLSEQDGQFLEVTIKSQVDKPKIYPIDEAEYAKLVTHTVRREDKVVSVSVPQSAESEHELIAASPVEIRESIKMQALLAEIGAKMGMKIWLPRNDRAAVVREWQQPESSLLDVLPLNYDDTTLKTIEQIDVLWLRGRSIVRAFEVEHTTSIYSGILRMADLLALQPNMDINLHIVAPIARRDKVFQELRRPVFSLLEKGPLYESCTYLSYDSLKELVKDKHLAHLSDKVLDEYAEQAE